MIRCFSGSISPLVSSTRPFTQPCVLSGSALRYVKAIILQNGLDSQFQTLSTILATLQNCCPPADLLGGCTIPQEKIPQLQQNAKLLNTQIAHARKSLEKIRKSSQQRPQAQEEINLFENADQALVNAQYYLATILEADLSHDLYLNSCLNDSFERIHRLHRKVQNFLVQSVWHNKESSFTPP